MTSVNLQFDKMVVDTTLAQEYIKKNNCIFRCTANIEKDQYMYDAANNKICLDINTSTVFETVTIDKCNFFLLQLSNNIYDKKNLFCQLEYLIRKKPIKSTQLELEMIIRHLRYQASASTSKLRLNRTLVMKNDSPLIDLGFFPLFGPSQHIWATENTAVVCYLFRELCNLSGFSAVHLSFIKKEEIPFDDNFSITKNRVLEGGCIGVVTEQCDLDSALDMFLSVDTGGLWGMRRILVQESVIERFNKEFAWKTRSSSQADADPKLKSLCTDLHVYEDKIFLREYVGNTDLPNAVLIESFRTVKEVLALVNGYRPFCVSLWSHGVAESNEIALAAAAPVVWVNGHGTLGDPLQVSLAYYSQIRLSSCENNPKLDGVRKLQKEWAKLSVANRRAKALSKIGMMVDDHWRKYYQGILCSEIHKRNFVHVTGGELVVGYSVPHDVYAIHVIDSPASAEEIIDCLIGGSGLLINISSEGNDSLEEFVTMLSEAGLPIQLANFEFASDALPLPHTTRIIHSTFGTIFAN